MRVRGFTIGRDPYIKEHCKIINKDYRYGKKGVLEFKAERYPAGFEIKFFQNINYTNQYGGYYDFDKFNKMPYIIKLMFVNEINKIAEFLQTLGISNKTKPNYELIKDKIKQDYVDSWHHPQTDMDFELSDLDGTTCEEGSDNVDRDGKIIYNGQIKYFRDWDGRLGRGKVYYNLNNMWWVILNDKDYTNKADFELFDATKEDFEIKRLVKDRRPKEYIDRMDKVNQTSTKELINELKRRGIKIVRR